MKEKNGGTGMSDAALKTFVIRPHSTIRPKSGFFFLTDLSTDIFQDTSSLETFGLPPSANLLSGPGMAFPCTLTSQERLSASKPFDCPVTSCRNNSVP